jgi:hypothetical protein
LRREAVQRIEHPPAGQPNFAPQYLAVAKLGAILPFDLLSF